ncbi:MAG TPA: 4-hydroxy-tetrahydrodipicolinate synthase [Acidimicrobiia bacterium]
MPNAPFGLVATAMITPFAPDGGVDHETAWRLARHLSDNGTDCLVVTGTTGESPTLSDTEKLALYHTVVDAVKEKDTLVVAGTGTYDTRHSVELSEKAAESGVDGILAVTPYYNRPSQEGLIAHFGAIADVGLPTMLYNIPGRTGRRIEIETLARLADHPNIVAVKDAVMDLEFTSKTIGVVPDLAVYCGQDSLTLPSLAVGAVGVVSVASHLVGRQIAAMIQAANEGDLAEARRLHHLLYPVFEACFLETNPAPVKAAVNAFWGPVGDVRLPLVNASAETVAAIEKALAAVGGL